MIATALNVQRRQRETFTVREDKVKQVVVEIRVHLWRRIVSPFGQRTSNWRVRIVERQRRVEQIVAGRSGVEQVVVGVGFSQLQWHQRVAESHRSGREFVRDLRIQLRVILAEVAAL